MSNTSQDAISAVSYSQLNEEQKRKKTARETEVFMGPNYLRVAQMHMNSEQVLRVNSDIRTKILQTLPAIASTIEIQTGLGSIALDVIATDISRTRDHFTAAKDTLRNMTTCLRLVILCLQIIVQI